jgi:Planctomycete cytochrome C
MRNISRFMVLGTGIVLLAGAALVQDSAAQTHKTRAHYHSMGFSEIAPILNANCVSCHNATKHPDKVDLSSYEAVMHSGAHGKIVIPSNPINSPIMKYIRGIKTPQMPLNKPPLSADKQGLVSNWILYGATKKKVIEKY